MCCSGWVMSCTVIHDAAIRGQVIHPFLLHSSHVRHHSCSHEFNEIQLTGICLFILLFQVWHIKLTNWWSRYFKLWDYWLWDRDSLSIDGHPLAGSPEKAQPQSIPSTKIPPSWFHLIRSTLEAGVVSCWYQIYTLNSTKFIMDTPKPKIWDWCCRFESFFAKWLCVSTLLQSEWVQGLKTLKVRMP